MESAHETFNERYRNLFARRTGTDGISFVHLRFYTMFHVWRKLRKEKNKCSQTDISFLLLFQIAKTCWKHTHTTFYQNFSLFLLVFCYSLISDKEPGVLFKADSKENCLWFVWLLLALEIDVYACFTFLWKWSQPKQISICLLAIRRAVFGSTFSLFLLRM